jgi:sigma-B regulation protein RsbU (phosphoserine phosphatase)
MHLVNRSLARRMVALILLGAGLVVLLVQGYGHMEQRRRMLDHDKTAGATLAKSVAFQIEAALGRAEAVVQQTALQLAGREIRRGDGADLIGRTLEAHPSIFAMAVALPEAAAARSDFKILYGWRGAQGIAVQEREDPLKDYQQDWFVLPAQMRRPAWVEPYYDEQGGATMVTYAVPVLHGGEVAAVVTCDLSLAGIRSLLAGLSLGKEGMAVLLSRRGTFIAHPNRPNLEMKETIFSLAEASTDAEVGRALNELGRRMLAGQPGHMRYRRPYGDDMRMAHMYYETVPCTGWALGLFWPEDQVLAPLARLNRRSALVAAASLALLLIPALLIARSVARPLHHLADTAQRLATGDFEAPLPEIRTHDEVARLTAAFDQMRRDLRHYIADLTATTAAKERIAGELSAAREIQMSIVPKLFPPLPNRPDIDLYAMLIPALEVGGDLYDFALLDDDHLYVAIGDVSGKGVPASLLMAVGKTLLKSTVQTVRAPARALMHVNNEIAEDNESCMFITMFCGILNLRTGDFIYANAGHNPPLLVRQDGTVERLDERPSPALGARTGVAYPSYSRRLRLGDLLVLYTDGVTEAMNPGNVMFGESGLLSYLQREGRQKARTLLEGLGRTVEAHAAGAPQSDDITALAVRYCDRPAPTFATGSGLTLMEAPPDAVLSLRNHLEEIPRLAGWLEEQAAPLRIPPALLGNLNLALEEWVVNVISYAHPDPAEHRIELQFWRQPDSLRVTIEDDGVPFDPTAQAEADTTLALEHRQVGGLGIHFIRKTMDRFSYRREGDRNIVTLVKKIAGETA